MFKASRLFAGGFVLQFVGRVRSRETGVGSRERGVRIGRECAVIGGADAEGLEPGEFVAEVFVLTAEMGEVPVEGGKRCRSLDEALER